MMKLELLGSAVATAAAGTASAPDGEGWVRVVIPIERIDHAAGELIRLGVDVEALAPQELRDRIAEMARDVSRLYRRRRGAQ
jgi:predicted DNA-binding transcriptional regulator YafY